MRLRPDEPGHVVLSICPRTQCSGGDAGLLVAQIYGLKSVDMIAPLSTHRFQVLADFGVAHRAVSPLQDEGSYLGIVGIAALALLVGRAVSGVVNRRTPAVPMEAWQVLWVLLFFSTGGLNAILGLLGFTLFRTGCRYSVVILAIVLLHAAKWLTALQTQMEERACDGRTQILFQGWSGCRVPAESLGSASPLTDGHAEGDDRAASGGGSRFVAEMEAVLPEQAMVFQLPVMEFPEAPVLGLLPYDHFRPYLYSKTLRFSFGSVKGRDRDKWQSSSRRCLSRRRYRKSRIAASRRSTSAVTGILTAAKRLKTKCSRWATQRRAPRTHGRSQCILLQKN